MLDVIIIVIIINKNQQANIYVLRNHTPGTVPAALQFFF